MHGMFNKMISFQFFSHDVANAMEHYRDKENVEELQDCHATVAFIRKVADLRKAMNARHPWDSLRDDDENEGKKVSFLSLQNLKIAVLLQQTK